MAKVICKNCGFANPAGIDACVKCNQRISSGFREMVAGKITKWFGSKPAAKAEVPKAEVNKVKSLTGDVVMTDTGESFQVGQLLGRGSYCDVYLCRNPDSRERFALKLLRFWEIEQRGREEVETRFWFEYRMGLIESPFLVSAFQKGVAEGNPFYIMELCEGGTLADRIGGHWTETRLRRLGADILKGLDVLHQQGVTHRDLKPQNVIFKSSKCKLIDFGVSGRKNVRMTTQGSILGTDVYLAPEWLNPELKEQLTRVPTVDIYSFGIVMFEVISGGKFPYGSKPGTTTSEEAYEAELEAYYQNVRDNRWTGLNELFLEGKISDFWAGLIQKCLYHNPRERFQDANQILHLLGDPNTANYCPNCDQPIQNRRGTNCAECGSYLLSGTMSLRVSNGEDAGMLYNLSVLHMEKQVITLGRQVEDGPQNDIVIKDYETMLTVSRYHATIEKSEKTGMWFIRDGQWRENNNGEPVWTLSKNGIYVNNVKAGYMGAPFFPNDIIAIGNIVLAVDFTPN